jgi:hypothetical protein
LATTAAASDGSPEANIATIAFSTPVEVVGRTIPLSLKAFGGDRGVCVPERRRSWEAAIERLVGSRSQPSTRHNHHAGLGHGPTSAGT